MARVEHQFRIAEIEVSKHPADDKIVGIFRFESAGPTKHGPLLLIVAEIHSTLYIYERLLDVINAAADQARSPDLARKKERRSAGTASTSTPWNCPKGTSA
jgi:hypothetical protein